MLLRCTNPEKHMDKWYSVRIQEQGTLFDQYVVVCAWGSRQNRYQKQRAIPVPNMVEGHKLVEKIIAKKIKKGYFPIKEH